MESVAILAVNSGTKSLLEEEHHQHLQELFQDMLILLEANFNVIFIQWVRRSVTKQYQEYLDQLVMMMSGEVMPNVKLMTVSGDGWSTISAFVMVSLILTTHASLVSNPILIYLNVSSSFDTINHQQLFSRFQQMIS